MSTAIYARISEDRADGAGVDRQLKDCRALIKRHGWGPAREFADNDVSAYNGKPRPRYSEMLAAVKAGDVDRIVVYNLDRLYRQPKELEVIIELAERGRVSVVTCNNGDLGLGDDEGDGVFMARLLVNVANKASKDTSRRVRRAKKQARENGTPMGGPRPFGWKAVPVLDNAGRQVLSRRGLPRMTWRSDEPDPREAQLIREAVDSLLAGGSLADVARRWNDAGVGQPQTGRANWQADTVRQVVGNPRHAGLVGHRVHQIDAEGRERYLRPVVVAKGSWPAIVARERWERLQALLAERGAAGRIPRRRSLLTGLLTCGACGAGMNRSGGRWGIKTAAVRRVWRCYQCGGVSIDATSLEQFLTEATWERADTASLAKVVQQKGKEGKEAARLVAQLDQLQGRLDAASDSYSAGRLPVRAFERASAAIQHEQRALQTRLGTLTSTSVVAPFAGRPGVLRSAWSRLGLDQQRTIIGIALGKITVSPAAHPGRPRFDPDRVRIATPTA